MTVYVDELVDYGARVRGPAVRHGTVWCHLTADTPDELHRFAARIGLRRSWYQDAPHTWHYDLTPGMRKRAVAAGAVELTWREMGQFVADRRAVADGCSPQYGIAARHSQPTQPTLDLRLDST